MKTPPQLFFMCLSEEKMNKVSAIDLFCGVGGLSNGLIRSGIEVHAGIDLDPDCKWAYETNNSAVYIHADISTVSGKDLLRIWEKDCIKLLAGCAPCQPFSSYQKGKKSVDDNKWKLLNEFSRLVIETQPELITMENVPQLQSHSVFAKFKKTLKENGYFIWNDVVNCLDYGIPQKRHRLVLLASKLGEITLDNPTHADSHLSVRDAIGHLTPLRAGERDKIDSLHACAHLSPLNLERIKQSKQGGTWKDWKPEIVANCHKKDSGKSYQSVYGRMSWDKPAPTMTTLCFGYGNGRFGHPTQNRAISLREAAIFQSFPENYAFIPENGKIHFSKLGRMIGNAVPVRLGEVVGQSFMTHVKDKLDWRENG